MSEGWRDPDQGSAVLTPSMRRYVLDEGYRDEVSPQYLSKVRRKMKQRVRTSLNDIHLLFEELSDDEVRELFITPADEDATGNEPPPAHADLSPLLALVYRVGLVGEKPPMVPRFDRAYLVQRASRPHPTADKMYQTLSERAINAALRVNGEMGSLEINVDVTDAQPLDDLEEEPITDLTTEELARLVADGRVDREKFVEEMERRAGDQ